MEPNLCRLATLIVDLMMYLISGSESTAFPVGCVEWAFEMRFRGAMAVLCPLIWSFGVGHAVWLDLL